MSDFRCTTSPPVAIYRSAVRRRLRGSQPGYPTTTVGFGSPGGWSIVDRDGLVVVGGIASRTEARQLLTRLTAADDRRLLAVLDPDGLRTGDSTRYTAHSVGGSAGAPTVLRESPVRRAALRVPEVTAYFWVIKALSTAFGESTSDYLVHAIDPVIAVGIGFVVFVVALLLQFRQRRYVALAYWFAVVGVGVFGTMAADVLHVRFGVPYAASTILYAVALAVVFLTWGNTEHTLSIHTINTGRRECFYWAAVMATFAMGTALGDLTAITLHLGYLGSAVLFAALMLVPAAGYWLLGVNPILTFWVAYVLTRPLGASVADYLGKPVSHGGRGWGDGPVTLLLGAAIVALVVYLAVTRADVQSEPGVVSGRRRAVRAGE
jgi:uncharacterized membrane-anchored protein